MLNELLDQSSKNNYIYGDAPILEAFDIKGVNHCYGDGDYKEKVINEIHSIEELKSNGEEALITKSFMEEIDRICMGRTEKIDYGIPVQYMIQVDSLKVENLIIDALVETLYDNDRIQACKQGTMTFEMNYENISNDYMKFALESSRYGVFVLRYKFNVDEEMENDFISEKSAAIEKICEAIRPYKQDNVIVFSLPRNCKKTKDMFYSNLDGYTLVEIGEDLVFDDRAKDYLCRSADAYNAESFKVRVDKIIEKGKGYTASELDRIFDKEYEKYIREDVFPQYAEMKSIQKKQAEVEVKGDAYKTLMDMIGLESAKKLINQAIDYYKATKIFGNKFAHNRPTMHMVFKGNPGTAKTTVARLFAQIMKDNGVLSEGALVEVGRSELVGKYVGWTASIVKEKFTSAKGSVLFIDEAYSLVDDKSGLYGDEAINTIVQEMENHRDDVIVIFAGYPDKMDEFIARNPGLRSRIGFQVMFDDYSTPELMDITKLIASQNGRLLEKDAFDKIKPVFEKVKYEEDFGNGRFARNLVERATMKQATRLLKDVDNVKDDDIKVLKAEDFDLSETDNKSRVIRTIGFKGVDSDD